MKVFCMFVRFEEAKVKTKLFFILENHSRDFSVESVKFIELVKED